MTAPQLVFGWGNACRGDDALGPVLIERLRALALPGVTGLERVEGTDRRVVVAFDPVRTRRAIVGASESGRHGAGRRPLVGS